MIKFKYKHVQNEWVGVSPEINQIAKQVYWGLHLHENQEMPVYMLSMNMKPIVLLS